MLAMPLLLSWQILPPKLRYNNTILLYIGIFFLFSLKGDSLIVSAEGVEGWKMGRARGFNPGSR